MIARHVLDALDSGPDDPDARELVALALDQLERAGRRAEALGSPDEALRHYTTALAREPDLTDRARVLEGAARAARSSGRAEEAIKLAEQSRDAYASLGRPIDAGRAVALVGDALTMLGQHRAATEQMTPVYDSLVDVAGADEAILLLAETLARSHSILNQPAAAQRYADRALPLAEARQDWEQVVSLLGRQAVIWMMTGRPTGSVALFRAAAELGRRHNLARAMIVPLLNTSAMLKNRDLALALASGREGLELAAKVGASDLRSPTLSNLALVCWVSGDWDEVVALETQFGDDLGRYIDHSMVRLLVAFIRTARDEAMDLDSPVPDVDQDDRLGVWIGTIFEALRADQRGDDAQATTAFALAMDQAHQAFEIDDDFAIVWPIAVERMLSSGQIEDAERFLAFVADAPPGLVTPLAHAHLLRLRGLVGVARGADDADIDADLELATTELRDFGARFYLGRVLLERARRATERGDDEAAAPLLDEATAIFKELKAARWVAETAGVDAPR